VFLAESGLSGVTAPGIYGGTLRMSPSTMALSHYSVTPGVTLTGKLHVTSVTYPLEFIGTVTIAGSTASAGQLTSVGGHLGGRLGGRRVIR
jgi:hypothetical protein